MSSGRILVAGLSPALQQILCFERVIPGEVNRALEAHWCASGKVLNVARACAALGAPTSVVTAVGGRTGQAIRDEFAALPLKARWINTVENTRTCTTILETSTGRTTELVENAGPMAVRILELFQTEFRKLTEDAALVVFTGSLPAGTPPQFVAELLASVRVPIILDIRGPELLACLPLQPLLVKPNREELAKTFPGTATTSISPAVAMENLAKSGAKAVAISLGASGLDLLVDGNCHRLQPARVKTVNPIGCGDCLAAGIAVGTLAGENILNAVRLGMGAAAQNAATLLPARIDLETARLFASQIQA